MRHGIAFLHTSPVHVPVFEALVQRLSPGLRAHHAVDESLLADARVHGAADPAIVRRVERAMSEAAGASGARVVVCTCSTVGGAAERMATRGAFTAARIDRAMADRAVALGPRVRVVAALASTLAPTAALIHESAQALGRPVEVQPVLVAGAWAHFERGDTNAYLDAIARAVRGAASESPADVVVLAQASMAEAVGLLGDLGYEVLASPALGVQSAIDRLHGHGG